MKKQNKLGFFVFLSVFLRSFLIQAVWNYQSMLSIGFSFSLIPVAKKLFKDREERIAFFNRHLNFFNAHPYFSSFALGAITRIEQDMVKENDHDYMKIDRLKNALMGPLGAIGDQLVWATLKPASILVGLLAVILLDNLETQVLFLFIILLIYNIPHFYIRIYGLLRGYEMGYTVYKILNLDHFKIVRRTYGAIGALALGIIISYYGLHNANANFWFIIVFALSFFSAYFYRKIWQSVYRSLVLPLLVAVLLGFLIENL